MLKRPRAAAPTTPRDGLRGDTVGQAGSTLSTPLQDAMNEQIRHEFAAAYRYLAMAGYCEAINLHGCARWLRTQAREEVEHGMKVFDFLLDRGVRPTLRAIDAPPADFASAAEVFQAAYDHERRVTGLIHDLYERAREDRDYASQALLQWFVTEQVEEEKITSDAAALLRMAGDDPAALLVADRELGSRESD